MTTLWTDAIARTLLHSLWEGAATALVLAAILCFLRSPSARYAAGCVAMLVVLSSLLVTFTHFIPERPVHPLPLGLAPAPDVATDAALPPVPMEPLPSDKLTWLVVFWMAGVLVFHLRGVMSWMAARRLRRTGVCVAPEEWQERLQCLSSWLGLTDPVALWESCLADVPVVVGYVRPVILMPVGLLAGLPTGQVEAILLHELAHIRRYDYLVNLAQVFVEGLLFYHPAVWWISGVMRKEREHCCDDLAVQMSGGALEYATALTALEQRRMNATAALAATGGSLVDRVKRVLGRSEPRYAGAMPLVTAALLALAAVTAVMALQVGSDPRGPSKTAGSMGASQQLAPVAPPPTPSPDPGYQRAIKGNVDRIIRAEERKAFDRMEFDVLLAQAQQPPAGPNPITERRLPGPMAAYERWLNEDVVYIITAEERAAFLQLTTDDEREKFVEQFWLRRDPTPGTARNEFKEEHYRRISYANDHFGYPDRAGWRSDRGSTYIQYGPPNEIDDHESPGTEPPNVLWRYRWIEGMGQNVVVQFVDSNKDGEYKMTTDPASK